jgi:hypothetical protein
MEAGIEILKHIDNSHNMNAIEQACLYALMLRQFGTDHTHWNGQLGHGW